MENKKERSDKREMEDKKIIEDKEKNWMKYGEKIEIKEKIEEILVGKVDKIMSGEKINRMLKRIDKKIGGNGEEIEDLGINKIEIEIEIGEIKKS